MTSRGARHFSLGANGSRFAVVRATPRSRTMVHIAAALCVLLAAGESFAQANVRPEKLAEGQRVEIKGRRGGSDSIDASRVRVQEPDRASKIEGTVAAFDPRTRELTISGFPIALRDGARVEREGEVLTVDAIRVGDIIEARGEWNGQVLRADRLRIRLDTPGSRPPAEADIEGNIERVDAAAGTFVVIGHTVHLGKGSKVVDERAATPTEAVPNDRLRRDVDDLHVAPIRIGERVTVGGRIGGDLRGHRRQLAVNQDRERQDTAMASAQVIATATLPRHIELYTKMGAEQLFGHIDTGGPLSTGGAFRVSEAYVLFGSDTRVSLQIGRQRFRDAREWFYDDYLDALRFHVRGGSWRAEAAVAEGVFAGPRDLRARGDQRQAIASFTQTVGERTEASTFFLYRDDRLRRERPVWLGALWNGRATSALRYWGIGAVRRGESDTQKLRGWAMDSGVSWRLALPLTPAITARYAIGSGDKPGTDDADTRFRQTGLEDNTARFHGLKRFAQYGEVFDPELSNVSVLTFGLGAKPFSRTSVDLVYHRYRQRERRRSLMSNRLDAAGNGDSLDLGDELDLIIAIQQVRRVDFSVVVGAYRPGDGIASPTRAVLYWKPEVRFFF